MITTRSILFGGVVECFGAIAVLLQTLTSTVASLFVLLMLSITWVSAAKMKKRFAGGYERDIILLLVSLALTSHRHHKCYLRM